MSLTSALFLTLGAVAHRSGFVPLGLIKQRERYYDLEVWVFHTVSTMFRAQDFLCALCAAFEVIHYLSFNLLSEPTPQSARSSAFESISGSLEAGLSPALVLGSIVLLLDAHIRWMAVKMLEPTISSFGVVVHLDRPPGFYSSVRERLPNVSIPPIMVFGIGILCGLVLPSVSLAIWRLVRDSLLSAQKIAARLSHKLYLQCTSLSLAARKEYERLLFDFKERYMYYKSRLQAFLVTIFVLLFFAFMLAAYLFFLYAATVSLISFFVRFFNFIWVPFQILVALGYIILLL